MHLLTAIAATVHLEFMYEVLCQAPYIDCHCESSDKKYQIKNANSVLCTGKLRLLEVK